MTDQERQDLHEALKDAFPSSEEIRLLVSLHLHDALGAIPEPATLNIQIVALLEWADANEQIDALVAGAREQNAQNKMLAAFAGRWKTRPADAGVTRSSGSGRRSVLPTEPEGLVRLMSIGVVLMMFCLGSLFVAYLVIVEKAPWWAIPTMFALLGTVGIGQARRVAVRA